MALISYTNKVALNENPEIADINKVTDDDMNEIKQVVNDNYNNTIVISDTQPTSEDNKLFVDTSEDGDSFTEITNEYSTSTGKGYSANYINNLHTYSTTEQVIGTYLGKPLYRKTFTGTTSTTISNVMLTNSGDIEKIISSKGYIEQSNTVQLLVGETVYHADSSFTAFTRVINVNNNLRLDCNYTVFGGKYYEVTVEYTKTTD